MATRDITDEQVCRAVQAYQDAIRAPYEGLAIFGFTLASDAPPFPYEALAAQTGQPEKVCYRAMERAERRGLIEVGTSLRTGWLSEKGKELLVLSELNDRNLRAMIDASERNEAALRSPS